MAKQFEEPQQFQRENSAHELFNKHGIYEEIMDQHHRELEQY